MKKNQYKVLCRAMDEILLEGEIKLSRLAISWLHIVRAHPDILKKYEFLFLNEGLLFFFVRFTKCFMYVLFSCCKLIIKTVLNDSSNNWRKILKNINKSDVLFVSHLINKTQYNNKTDFYLADLPRKMVLAGYSNLTVMINHTGLSQNQFSFKDEKLLSKMVLPDTLGFCQEISNIFKLCKESGKLMSIAKNENDLLKKKIYFWSALEALGVNSLFSLRKYYQIKQILEIANSSIIIVTYEGHAWERMVFKGARSANSSIKCVGYTHAPLFEHQHSVCRLIGKGYDPDQILTAGTIQKRQLESTNNFSGITIDILGSKRVNAFKILKTKNTYKFRNAQNQKKTCLVLPEGIESEIKLLFNYSLKCAKKFPNLHFIWRLHPLFSFTGLSIKDPLYRSIPHNIEFSSNMSIEDDFVHSQWALYRGSSSVIQAVIAGLKPVYLHRSSEMKFDPLYELNVWREEVESIDDLESIMGTFFEYNESFVEAVEYAEKIYEPLNPLPLLQLLNDNVKNG